MEMPAVVTTVIGWIPKMIEIFMEPPAIYFVGLALVGGLSGLTRKFVPMRRK